MLAHEFGHFSQGTGMRLTYVIRPVSYAYETQIGGSDGFESTSLRISQLGAASQAAHQQLAETWKERRLVNNLPALIAVRLSTFDPPTLQAIREHALNQKTGSLDTHPADADRIAAARRINVPGVFDLEAPADVLFTRFDALGLEVTREYYARMIGGAVDEAKLQRLGGATAASYELEPMLRAIEALHRQEGEIRAIRTELMRMQGVLVELTRDPERNQNLVNGIRNATRVLANRLRRLGSESGQVAFAGYVELGSRRCRTGRR